MDPYAGLTFSGGDADHNAAIWNFLDMGMGPWGGIAIYGGIGLGHWKLQGKSSVLGMLRGSAQASMRAPLSRHWTAGMKPDVQDYLRRTGSKATDRFINLSEDVWAAKARGKGTRGLYHRMVEINRKRGTTLIQRYGARPAARIAAGHVLGRALTFFNVIGSLALGAELGRMVTQSIVDWTPTVAKPVELDFGTGFVEESFQARTMRQQSLAAIHNSQLTVRAALGNEAVHIHQ